MPHARPPLPPAPYLVVGLARSGEAAARALRDRGAAVIGVDARAPAGAGRLRAAGVEVHTESSGLELVDRAGTVVKSPGVPAGAPVIAAARERGLPVIGELELAWRLLSNDFIAVTGTNGKTTTTELLGHIHREAGVPVAVAGNVGTALASLVGRLDPAATVVAEASSFQLEDTEAFAPDAAVLLNLTPDHLDRHGTLEAYAAAKLRAFARQDAADVAVVPEDLDVRPLPGAARRVVVGYGEDADLGERDGALWWRVPGTPNAERLLDTDEIRLRGVHNRQNAMAAAAIALMRGIPPAAVASALRSFPGVPHRLEEVARRDGVLYVNDSKATNVASTTVALVAFEGRVHLILGGQAKAQSFVPLRGPIVERCAAVYVIGEDADRIVADLAGIAAPVHRYDDLAGAVAAARAVATAGDTVLLSPACASFDQYRNFEERGDHFRALAAGEAAT